MTDTDRSVLGHQTRNWPAEYFQAKGMCGVEYSQRAREVHVAVTMETELHATEGTEELSTEDMEENRNPGRAIYTGETWSHQHAHSEVPVTVSWQRLLTLPGRELQTRLTQRAETPLCEDAPSSFSVFQKETRLALGIGSVETGGTNVLCGKAQSTQNHCPGHGASSRTRRCGSEFLF